MSGPADNSPVCPKCGLFLAVRGCTLETCVEESGRRSTSPSVPLAPPPWRWTWNGAWYLRDATGDAIWGYYLDEGDVEPSPRVRALTEAAPDSAAGVATLIRHLESLGHDGGPHGDPTKVRTPCEICRDIHRLRELLARIDERSRAR